MARMTYTEALREMEVGPDQGCLICLDNQGDTKVKWHRTSVVEVEAARTVFDTLKNSGHMAYKVSGEDGLKGELLHEFDPAAERIILAPPLAGG